MLENLNLLNEENIKSRVNFILSGAAEVDAGLSLNRGQSVGYYGLVARRIGSIGMITSLNMGERPHEYFLSTKEVVANGLVIARRVLILAHPDEVFEEGEYHPQYLYGLQGIDEQMKLITAEVTSWRMHSNTDAPQYRRTFYYSSVAGTIERLPEDKPNPFTQEEQERQAKVLGII